jgi:hypothetical protein
MQISQFLTFATFTSLLAFASMASAADTKTELDNKGRIRQLRFLDKQTEIDLALRAGPEQVSSDASVFVFGHNGYEKVKQGSNGFVCLVNRDGQQHGGDTLRPTCWDPEGSITIVPVMLRVGELLAQGQSALEIKHDIDAGYADGRFFAPRKTGIAYMLIGDIRYDPVTKAITNLFAGHYMIYAPGVTNADIGLTKDAKRAHPGLPSIYSGYSGGAHNAYLIVLASHDSGAH